MFKKLCILLIFSKLKVTKLFNRQISYAQLSVHDIHYLKDVKVDYSNCTVIGDRGYISAQVQLDLFVHIPEHTRSLSGSLLGYKTIP